MYYKITIYGACTPYPYIELHCLFCKERKMTYHQNLGPVCQFDEVAISQVNPKCMDYCNTYKRDFNHIQIMVLDGVIVLMLACNLSDPDIKIKGKPRKV